MRRLRASKGFSLIELAVVLVIVGLLVGGGIVALDATRMQMQRSDQQRQMEGVREALYGFAMSNGRLPCPDDPDNGIDGEEDRDSGVCTSNTGVFPYTDLALGYRDVWGFRLIYHVDPAFADEPFELDEPMPDPSDVDTITIEDGDGNRIAATPAVVVSVGPQGGQVWTDDGYFCPGDSADGIVTDGFSDDETDNCDFAENSRYIDAAVRADDADDGRFDDILVWIPAPVLKARLVDAGRLP